MSGKTLLTAVFGLMALAADGLAGQAAPPPQRHESVVVNIEVPVRVYQNDAFVDGLTLADFEVLEDGVRQRLEAVYLIKGKLIVREEKAPGTAPPIPGNTRHYVLYLDLKEYLPRIGEAMDFFFGDVLGPGDSLFVVTPSKTYRFKPEALALVPRKEIAERLKGKLRADIQMGNSAYRNLMRDFYDLEETEYPGELLDLKEQQLFDMAKQMRDLNEVTEGRLMSVADSLKSLDGEKHVFLLYQKDVLPDHVFTDDRQAELFKTPGFDVGKVKRIFSDASITIHFFYITKKPAFSVKTLNIGRPDPSFSQPDLSADVYVAFKEMARATGGLADSTTNPHFAVKRAAEASSHYYLLYYRPLDYRADGTFRKIEVRVKNRELTVTHRLGYIAD